MSPPTIDDADLVAFDLELTGLDFKRDSIVSVGAVRMKGGRILPGQSFYRLVRPSSELKTQGVVVHGLTHTDLAAAAGVEEVLGEFVDFLGGATLVGHFVFIDLQFLGRAVEGTLGKALERRAVDTAEAHGWLCEHDENFARSRSGEHPRSDLFSMAREYGLVVEKVHNALFDAFVAAQLFQRLLPFLKRNDIGTLGALLEVAGA